MGGVKVPRVSHKSSAHSLPPVPSTGSRARATQSAARILVIEDEEDLAGLLLYNLRASGHVAEHASTGASALVRAMDFRPDLILLDLMLPDIAGTDLLRAIRGDSDLARTAVIIVTARGQEADRIAGLELGADDYVAKPFSVRELVLRVGAVLKRVSPEPELNQVIECGPIRLDSARHEAAVAGSSIALTALEFRLLRTLLERAGHVQTREVLLVDVWGISAEIETRTVDTHVKRLREKLGPAGDLIETIRGVGYKLNAPVPEEP
jgi:two-component system, OmpR family, phosphate regulon response regulator PhoB